MSGDTFVVWVGVVIVLLAGAGGGQTTRLVKHTVSTLTVSDDWRPGDGP